MPLGAGQYDAEACAAFEACRAEGVALMVFNGNRGNGFSVEASMRILAAMPGVLRSMADQIEKVLAEDLAAAAAEAAAEG